MEYRVILTKNGEYKKTLHKCKTRPTAFKNYHKIKEENNVFFPKRFINYNGIIPVEYTMYVVKEYEEGDEARVIRDELGRLRKEKVLFDKWTILASCPYEIEEDFYVFGNDPIHERLTIRGIMFKMISNLDNPLDIKRLIVVHNKLVIHNNTHFDMVICKCKKDAQRLHHALKKATDDKKFSNLLFAGTAQGPVISQMYELIHEETGWPMRKIRRTTTRP